MKFNEIGSILLTEEELKSKRIARKIQQLCDNDIIYCGECPYYSVNKPCTMWEYLK